MMANKSISRLFSVLIIIAFILALSFSAVDLTPAHAAGIRYATPGGTGDCSSWANACALQTALAGADNGDEIWAAAGTYKPSSAAADRMATFQLNSGVTLYGGFAGTETTRAQRNLAANVTILSGDIDHNDSQTPVITDLASVTGNTTNSYHVVTGMVGASGWALHDLTITAGCANGDDPVIWCLDCGGGMYNDGSSPTLINVIFSGNYARQGGGMYSAYVDPILTNVTFSHNTASGDGGGMFNDLSSAALTSVTFTGNTAAGTGGGMYNDSASFPILRNVTFSDNDATWGGGMSTSGGTPTLAEVSFNGNSATFGGGLYNTNSYSTPTLTVVTFSGNSATYGGGMYDNGSSPTLTNVTFSANSAGGGGGGGMFHDSGTAILTNVTFSSNDAWFGGGLAVVDDSASQIRNTIFWQNTDLSLDPDDSDQISSTRSNPRVTDSVLQGGCSSGINCFHIIAADPNLGVLGSYGGSTQTLPLLPGSSAIDSASDDVCPASDQRGVARPQGAHCDIGAFEATIAPNVSAITRLDPSPTHLASVRFAVSFSQPVTGVNASDFSLTTTGISGAGVSAISGSGSAYTVTVHTGSGSGSIRLDVLDNDTIVNVALDPLGGAGQGNGSYTTGEAYQVPPYPVYLPFSMR